MTDRHDIDRDLLTALQRLADETVVPPIDPARARVLLDAFDAAQRQVPQGRAPYWWMGSLAAAAALLIAFVVMPAREARRTLPSIQDAGRVHSSADGPGGAPRDPTVATEFVPWPGARDLPPLESGVLTRIDLPVSMLPALGLVPRPSQRAAVEADVIVGQDGLARAVRLVGD